MKQSRLCKQCGKVFPAEFSKNKIFCNSQCSIRWHYNKSDYTKMGISTGTVGAIGELMVCLDLLQNGLSVYRSISPNAKCDLIVSNPGKVLRIEVTTGYRHREKGTIMFPAKPDTYVFDVLAVVCKQEVIYIPEFDYKTLEIKPGDYPPIYRVDRTNTHAILKGATFG